MPLKFARSDRRLLLWAAAIFLPMMVALAMLSTGEQDTGIPSTYSAQSSGAKAAYLLLQDLGYKVDRWEQPPAELPVEAKNTVLVLAGPVNNPSPEERAALKLYLTRGGRILATGGNADLYLPEAQTMRELAPSPLPHLYHPQLVTALTRAGDIRMSPTSYWKECATACLAHYADESRPIVISESFGEGEFIWWASSGPLSNNGIGSDGNLQLLLSSLGRPQETRVLWDEYFHGFRRSAGSYVLEKPVLFGLLQLGALALAFLVTYSRRNGPIYPSDEPTRLSPLEFVETVGGLYRRAHAVRAALEVPYNRFRIQAVRQVGLKPEITASELARALRNRLGFKDNALEDLLHRIEAALYDPDLTESAALEMVQALNSHARQLQMISAGRQETASHAGSLASADSRKN
ncbi:MAG TPA: DUF4350 domain-containing protein [Candidatus Angelobacter sp.]|nr:DUF4350 domain-containing protein [Candidatus Angelobacter sp.]